MENEIIMNEMSEEVIDEVVAPAAEAAENFCSHSGKSKLVPILGVTALIGVIAAGVVFYRKMRRKSSGDEPAVQFSRVIDFDENDGNDDDEEETKDN